MTSTADAHVATAKKERGMRHVTLDMPARNAGSRRLCGAEQRHAATAAAQGGLGSRHSRLWPRPLRTAHRNAVPPASPGAGGLHRAGAGASKRLRRERAGAQVTSRDGPQENRVR